MSTPLATLFTKIGFDIDTASLTALHKQIDAIQARMQGLASALNPTAASRTASRLAISAQERAAAMAEVRQRRLERLQVRAHEINANLDTRRQRAEQAAQLRQMRQTDRQAAREMRDARQLADFQNREFNLRQRNLERAARQQQAERYRQMRTEANFLNREFNLRNRNAERERLRAERQQQIQDRINNRPSPRPASGGRGGIAGMGINAQTAISAVAGGGFVNQAYQVANFSMARNPQYEFLTGSKEEGAKQIEFVDKEVKRLSLDLMGANEQYKRLLASGATSIGIAKTQELFTNFSNLSTMLGLSADAQKRATNSLGQMLSKGQVMSEELKGQLAEALPNAVGIFADALYGNGKAGSGDKAKLFKDMEDGKVRLEELTKVISYMGTLTREDLIAQMLNTPAKKLAKLKTQWILTLEQLNDAGFLDMMITALEGVTALLVDLTKWIKENREEIKYWATEIIKAFKWLITNLPIIISYFAALKIGGWVTAMAAASTAVGGLSAALVPLLIRLALVPMVVALGALAMIEAYDTFKGQDTLWTRLAEQKDKGILGYFAAITKSVGDFVRLITSGLVTGAISMWGHLTGNEQLVEAAKATWAGSVTEFTGRQDRIWGDGGNKSDGSKPPPLPIDMWAWVKGERDRKAPHVPYPNPLYPKKEGLETKTPTTNYFSPMLTVHVANGDPVTIENTVNEVLGKWATKAAANTPAFSLLVK